MNIIKGLIITTFTKISCIHNIKKITFVHYSDWDWAHLEGTKDWLAAPERPSLCCICSCTERLYVTVIHGSGRDWELATEAPAWFFTCQIWKEFNDLLINLWSHTAACRWIICEANFKKKREMPSVVIIQYRSAGFIFPLVTRPAKITYGIYYAETHPAVLVHRTCQFCILPLCFWIQSWLCHYMAAAYLTALPTISPRATAG